MLKRDIEQYIKQIKNEIGKASGNYAGAIGAISAILERFEEELAEKNVNKQLATKQANEAKRRTSEEKIQNAMNILEFEGKKVTYYSIAQAAGMSYNTVKSRIENSEELRHRFKLLNKLS